MRGIWAALLALPIVGLVVAYFAFTFSEADDQGFKDFCGEATVVQDDFAQFYKNQKTYPAYTLDQLQQMGAVSGEVRSYQVYFTPFSSKTPDNQIVLRIGYGPFAVIPSLCDFSWTKYDLTHDSDPGQTPLKDHLEDAKLDQARTLAAEHPGARIFSTFAWFNGSTPEKGYAELIIEYFPSGENVTREMHYDLWQTGNAWTVGAAKQLR